MEPRRWPAVHETEVDDLDMDPWGWNCTCGAKADGFDTEADAENDALDHEETGR